MEYLNENVVPNPSIYPDGMYPWMAIRAGSDQNKLGYLTMAGDIDMNGHNLVNWSPAGNQQKLLQHRPCIISNPPSDRGTDATLLVGANWQKILWQAGRTVDTFGSGNLSFLADGSLKNNGALAIEVEINMMMNIDKPANSEVFIGLYDTSTASITKYQSYYESHPSYEKAHVCVAGLLSIPAGQQIQFVAQHNSGSPISVWNLQIFTHVL